MEVYKMDGSHWDSVHSQLASSIRLFQTLQRWNESQITLCKEKLERFRENERKLLNSSRYYENVENTINLLKLIEQNDAEKYGFDKKALDLQPDSRSQNIHLHGKQGQQQTHCSYNGTELFTNLSCIPPTVSYYGYCRDNTASTSDNDSLSEKKDKIDTSNWDSVHSQLASSVRLFLTLQQCNESQITLCKEKLEKFQENERKLSNSLRYYKNVRETVFLLKDFEEEENLPINLDELQPIHGNSPPRPLNNSCRCCNHGDNESNTSDQCVKDILLTVKSFPFHYFNENISNETGAKYENMNKATEAYRNTSNKTQQEKQESERTTEKKVDALLAPQHEKDSQEETKCVRKQCKHCSDPTCHKLSLVPLVISSDISPHRSEETNDNNGSKVCEEVETQYLDYNDSINHCNNISNYDDNETIAHIIAITRNYLNAQKNISNSNCCNSDKNANEKSTSLNSSCCCMEMNRNLFETIFPRCNSMPTITEEANNNNSNNNLNNMCDSTHARKNNNRNTPLLDSESNNNNNNNNSSSVSNDCSSKTSTETCELDGLPSILDCVHRQDNNESQPCKKDIKMCELDTTKLNNLVDSQQFKCNKKRKVSQSNGQLPTDGNKNTMVKIQYRRKWDSFTVKSK